MDPSLQNYSLESFSFGFSERYLLAPVCFWASAFRLGSAFFTRILLPLISRPLRFFIAALASPCLGISMKAKPFELPVSLSMTNVQDCTMPWVLNMVRSSFSVVFRERLRIKIFIVSPLLVL